MKYVNEFILLYTRVYLTYHSPSQATDWNNQNKPIICFNKWNAPSFIIYPPITYWNEANDKRQAKSEPRMEKFQRDEYKNWKLNTDKISRCWGAPRVLPQLKIKRNWCRQFALWLHSDGFEVFPRIDAFPERHRECGATDRHLFIYQQAADSWHSFITSFTSEK